jgi:hypothetical protein
MASEQERIIKAVLDLQRRGISHRSTSNDDNFSAPSHAAPLKPMREGAPTRAAPIKPLETKPVVQTNKPKD